MSDSDLETSFQITPYSVVYACDGHQLVDTFEMLTVYYVFSTLRRQTHANTFRHETFERGENDQPHRQARLQRGDVHAGGDTAVPPLQVRLDIKLQDS